MPILTQSANFRDNVLIELAQWTAEQVDIANVVASAPPPEPLLPLSL